MQKTTSVLKSSSNPQRCAATHSTAHIPRRCSSGIQGMFGTNEHSTSGRLLISSPLQTREDVLQRTQQHLFLGDVRLESKACTAQTNTEITVPVEVVWLVLSQLGYRTRRHGVENPKPLLHERHSSPFIDTFNNEGG